MQKHLRTLLLSVCSLACLLLPNAAAAKRPAPGAKPPAIAPQSSAKLRPGAQARTSAHKAKASAAGAHRIQPSAKKDRKLAAAKPAVRKPGRVATPKLRSTRANNAKQRGMRVQGPVVKAGKGGKASAAKPTKRVLKRGLVKKNAP